MKNRLIQFLEFKGISQRKLADLCGFATGLLSKDTISEKTINLICNQFDDLNKNWLLTGDGEMLKPSSSSPSALEERVRLLEDLVRRHDSQIRIFELLLSRPSIHNNQEGGNNNFNIEGKE